jgi:DNA-binding NarL/FixJ family response regulator
MQGSSRKRLGLAGHDKLFWAAGLHGASFAVEERVAMAEMKLRVYLLAENRLFREALTRILNKQNDIHVEGAAAFTIALLEPIVQLKPDILLSDASALCAPEQSFLPQLRNLLPSLKNVMIGMDADPELFLHAVCQGAVGYVLKDASAAEVVTAVRAVINNEAFCPRVLLRTLFEAVALRRVAAPTARVKRELGLSRREQQLIEMISEGLTNKEIAGRLNLSEQTVKNHVHRMLRKVGVSDRLMIVERWQEVRGSDLSFSSVTVPGRASVDFLVRGARI